MTAQRVPTVAFVTDAIYPYHQGGKEVRYHELTRRLADRASVHVYTMRWWQGSPVRREGGVTYHAISPRLPLYKNGRRSVTQALVFAACCLKLAWRRFDVIEADHMPYLQLLPLRLVATLRRRRLVVTWHEVWGPVYWRSYLGGAGGRVAWWLEHLSMRLPDAIIAASSHTAERLRAYLPPDRRVLVAPNGVDVELISGARPEPVRSDVVAVGRLIRHKRLDMLLDAVALLKRRGTEVFCRIVGDGPESGALHGRAAALGIADLIDFRDDVKDQEQLYGHLKAASVFVFPSEREGFGIALLEALATGLPVITTSAPDNLARHLAARSSRGVVCDPSSEALADAIQNVLRGEGPDRGEDDEWIAEFHWERVVDRVAEAVLE
jgi:glycosyltransferase involved in cell wall biosynthesis